MRPLTVAELLDVWERCLIQTQDQRAVLLLNAAQPDQTLAAWSAMSIGQRDALLLTLREQTFGPHLVSLADCPKCHQRVQVDIDIPDLRVSPSEQADTFQFTLDDYAVSYRLPNSDDLTAIASQTDLEVAHRILIEHCILRVENAGQAVLIDQVSSDLLDVIETHMEQHDPQARMQLALTCPQCSYSWSTILDIVTFFGAEINAWALRLLQDVHTLASAYGWHENEILALSPFRRQAYLDLINA